METRFGSGDHSSVGFYETQKGDDMSEVTAEKGAQDVQKELKNAIDRIIESHGRRKLVVAGPGAGKTTLFRKLLEATPGNKYTRQVLTFIVNLKNDLEKSLGDLASVFTLHGYCQFLLHRHLALRLD